MSTIAQNRAVWDRLAAGSIFSTVANDEECREPLKTLDSRGWLPASVAGLNVLCLAAAGGWQSILYASAGAHVTVLDISPGMLKIDDREARRRGLSLRLVEGSMDDLSDLTEESFDIVHQPVSTCYVGGLRRVFLEIARVLRDGGLYISQHKQPTSLQVTHRDSKDRYVLGLEYHHSGPLPRVPDQAYREGGASEYLHTWEELVGGLCQSGFVIEDLVEPLRADRNAQPGQVGHRGLYVPPYVRLKARRIGRDRNRSAAVLWTP